MKGPALALVVAVFPSKDLGEEPSRIGAARQEMTVVAVRGKKEIFFLETGKRSDPGRLLAHLDMVVALITSLGVESDQGFLKMAYEQHPSTKL